MSLVSQLILFNIHRIKDDLLIFTDVFGLRNIHLKGDMNNNKMERMNGEFRDREKVVRGIKKDDSPLIDGYQIYHNYIRPHMSLEGKTPSEVCGIKIEGNNKWRTLIQNASRSKICHHG